MKLFYFSNIHLGRSDAGNRHTVEICNGLTKLEHSVRLFVPLVAERAKTTLDASILVTPVPNPIKKPQLLASLLFYILLPFRAFPLIRKEKPEIIYTRSNFLEILTILPLKLFFNFTYTAELNGIRSLETSHSQIKRTLTKILERLSLQLMDKVIAVTPEIGDWAIQTGKLHVNNVAIIGNGVNTNLFHPILINEAKIKLNLEININYLNFTSSLKAWHDTRTIFQALPKIVLKFPNTKLLVAGDGPEKQQLMDLANELNVSTAIIWLGFVPVELVPIYINASVICLAPFSVERNLQTGVSPIKIFEYFACAKPIVTTKLGDSYNELIEHSGGGVLIPPHSPSELAKAVIRLLEEPENAKQMGKRGEKFVQSFSWQKIAKKTAGFLLNKRDSYA